MRPGIRAGLVVAAALVAASSDLSGRTATVRATITGRVTIVEAGIATPVRRARVTLSGGDLAADRTTDTDTDGRFRFDDVVSGTVRIRAAKPGFVMPGRGSFAAIGTPVETSAGGVFLVNIEMRPGAALEGRVFDEAGRPLAGIEVTAVHFEHGLLGRHPTDLTGTETDSTGHYRLHTLRPGSYYVRATPDQLSPADPVRLPGRAPMVPAATYYPGTAASEQAGRITLGPGEEVLGVDFALTSTEAVAVNGRIVRSSGETAAGLSVRLQAVGGPVGEVRGGFLPRTGDFFYRAVPPGDYWLSAVTAAADGFEAVTYRLTISGADAAGLTLRTAPGRRVTARMIVDDGSPLPEGIRVSAPETALNLPAPVGATVGGPTVLPAAGTADGIFDLGPLFGPRLIRIEDAPPSHALAVVRLGGQDISDTPVDFQATPGDIEIVVTRSVGRAQGTVTFADGRPAAGVPVVAFGVNDSTWGGLSRHVRPAESGLDGSFVFEGLLPGAYFIVAAPDLEANGWMSADVLRRISDGREHQVAAGATATVALMIGGTR